jgi:hypothetical protein
MAGCIHVQWTETMDCRFNAVRPNILSHARGRGVPVSGRPNGSPKKPTPCLFNPDRFLMTSLRIRFYPE